MQRRHFLHQLSVAGLAASTQAWWRDLNFGESFPLACQQYTWTTYYQREGKDWKHDLARSMQDSLAAGYHWLEPTFASVEEVKLLQRYMEAHDVKMRSLYVNSILHDKDAIQQSQESVLAIAEAAFPFGARIIVTNPSPIRWGGPENKTDDQLMLQAETLDQLGRALRKQGMVLAYHNHDAEMRLGAREFHHMLMATDPDHVALCLDSHWIYRGAGDSQVALFDIIEMYLDRVVELHLRQSHQGVWTETFGEGDIEYVRLVKALTARNIQPYLVMEQAIEPGTPHTMGIVEALAASRMYTRKHFSDLVPD